MSGNLGWIKLSHWHDSRSVAVDLSELHML